MRLFALKDEGRREGRRDGEEKGPDECWKRGEEDGGKRMESGVKNWRNEKKEKYESCKTFVSIFPQAQIMSSISAWTLFLRFTRL